MSLQKISLADRAAVEIREQIVRGVLAPGQRLTEQVFSESMGIARGTVRSAFSLLEAENLIARRAYTGWSVSEIDHRTLLESYQLRGALEELAVQLIVRSLDDAKAARLKQAMDRLAEAEKTGGSEERLRADLDFHALIVADSGNALLVKQYTSISGRIEWLYRWSEQKWPSRIDLVEWHRPIIEAILARDAEAAVQAARIHTENSLRDDVQDLMSTTEVDEQQNREPSMPNELLRLSRRGFLASATAAGVLTYGGAMPVRANVPQKGGTLRIAMSGASSDDSLDPRKFDKTMQRVVGVAVCNQLVELMPDGKMVPELAESWISDDAATWVIKVRDGVTFHNGKTLDAEDVVYSINLHRGEDTTSGAKALFESISEISATGPLEVTIKLGSPNAEFMGITADYHVLIVPNGFTDWEHLVGTGGYKLQTFEPGIRATLAKNADYWKSDRAHVDAVEIVVANDATSRLSALQSGAADIINGVDRNVAGFLEQAPNIEVVRSPGAVHWTYIADCSVDPTTNNHVRQALKFGCDREKILDVVLGGLGTLGNDHPISQGSAYYNTSLEQRVFDPDRAKYHLKQAGMDALTIELSTSEAVSAEAVDMAAVYQSGSSAAGINIDLKRWPADGYWSDVWMKKPFAMSAWLNRPIDQTFALIYKTGSRWNEGHWSSERFDTLLAEGIATVDFEKRKEIYWEMQQILSDEGPSVIPVFADFLDGKAARIKGFEPSGVAGLSGDRIVERVWIEE